MEEAEAPSAAKPRLSPGQVETKQKRETLELAQKKLQADLERATSERHRQMLANSLEEIGKQLKKLA